MIRLARQADAEAICDIYRHYVEDTVYSFEFVAPDADEMRRRMEKNQSDYPWLVYEDGGEILGYAYASKMSERAAYSHSADVSIYVRRDCHRRGIGRALYEKLEELLLRQNVALLLAIVSSPNTASRAFHESFGFREVGRMERAGRKFGRWVGLVYLVKDIDLGEEVGEFIGFSMLQEREATE